VRCFRLPRLIEEVARYAAMQKRSVLNRQLAKADLISSMTSTAIARSRTRSAIGPAENP
jgi:hypothetical protein